MPLTIPDSLIDNKPRTVTVQLPATWLAHQFVDWFVLNADDTFFDKVLAYEGVHLKIAKEGEDEFLVIVEQTD